jgi:hypothetical protein
MLSKMVEFQRHVIKLGKQHMHMLGHIRNVDETPFDMPSKKEKGVKTFDKRHRQQEGKNGTHSNRCRLWT